MVVRTPDGLARIIGDSYDEEGNHIIRVEILDEQTLHPKRDDFGHSFIAEFDAVDVYKVGRTGI